MAELIIGCPGEDYSSGNSKKSSGLSRKVKISGVRCIVLDEFDALLQYTAHVEPTVAIMDALIQQHGRALQRILCLATASDVIHASSSSSSKVDEEVERSSITTTAKSTPAINIESYLKPGYAHASVDDSDLLVTSGIIQTRVISKDGSSSSSTTTTTMTSIASRVSRTTIHGALHVTSQRLALEAVRKILNTQPVPQQALIFVDSSRRVDIVIDKLSKMDILIIPVMHYMLLDQYIMQLMVVLRQVVVTLVVCLHIRMSWRLYGLRSLLVIPHSPINSFSSLLLQ
jgi:superfamily II DNA/RNA helicase